MKKKKLLLLIIVVLSLFLTACQKKDEEINENYQFTQWKEDGVIREVVTYVEDVVNPDSSNYIPEEDRIVVFDLDGTLFCEQGTIYYEWMMYTQRVLADETYEASQDMKDLAVQILQAGIDKSIPENIEEDESLALGKAFNGMLTDDYKEYIRNFMEQEMDGFTGMTYKDSYYRPMVEVLEYLDQNDFVIYIVSGTDRDLCRVTMDYFYHLPYYQIIGTDCYNEGSHHDDVNYLEYQYDRDEEVMRDDTRIIKNVKSSKITQMYQEIGQKPVMAVGNSSGDQSMFTFTATNDKYKTAVFCVVPDDDVREYANMSKVEKLTKMCEENGYHVISMKDDFLTIYGEGVTKDATKLDLTEYLLALYEKSKQK